jgi:hypothetical protein
VNFYIILRAETDSLSRKADDIKKCLRQESNSHHVDYIIDAHNRNTNY